MMAMAQPPISPQNLRRGEIPTRSSARPVTKMTRAPVRTPRISLVRSTKTIREKMKAMAMAMPPSRGVIWLCRLRPPGRSTMPLSRAQCLRNGTMIREENMAVMKM